MNLKEFADNLGLEDEEFWEIVELFLETGASDLRKLQSAIDEKSNQKVAEAAHSIKGASINLGFLGVYEAAKKIEEEARNGRLEGITESTQALKRELNAIAELARD